MSNSMISPKYKMQLVSEVTDSIWGRYHSYAKARTFIEMFQHNEYDSDGVYSGQNFEIVKKVGAEIDLLRTLARMPDDIFFSIAVESGVSIPMIIPAFPTFKRDLSKLELGTGVLINNFEKAYKLVYEDPAQSIALANSTLESIIKHILESGKIPNVTYNKRDTLKELAQKILKGFGFFPTSTLPKNIRNIGSSLLKLTNEIEELRSDATFTHGKGKSDYIIDNSLYSVFIINSIITVGLFLLAFFEQKYLGQHDIQSDVEEVSF